MEGRTYLGIVHCVTSRMSVPRIERVARFVQDVLCEFCLPAKLVQAEMQLCHSNIDSNRLHENLGRREKHKRLQIKCHRRPPGLTGFPNEQILLARNDRFRPFRGAGRQIKSLENK